MSVSVKSPKSGPEFSSKLLTWLGSGVGLGIGLGLGLGLGVGVGLGIGLGLGIAHRVVERDEQYE